MEFWKSHFDKLFLGIFMLPLMICIVYLSDKPQAIETLKWCQGMFRDLTIALLTIITGRILRGEPAALPLPPVPNGNGKPL